MNPLALNLLKKISMYALAFAAGVAVTAWIGHTIYDARVQKLKAQKVDAVKAETLRLTHQFNQQKALTDGLNRDNQSRIADLDKRLADIKRVRPNTCTPIIVRPAAAPGRNTSETQGGVSRHDGYGVESDFLYDFAATADKIVVDQNTCVDTLDAIYKGNGQ